jgi:thiol:disulfide interchange protein DsbD
MRTLVVFLAIAGTAFSQRNQVSWSLSAEPAAAPPGGQVLLKLKGSIEPGWHLYSMTTEAAIPTRIEVAPNPAVESVRILQPRPKRAFDPNFQRDTETFENEAVFLVETQFRKDAAAGPAELTASVRYQVCNDRLCIPPVTRTAATTVAIDPAAQSAAAIIPAGYAEPGSAPPSGAPAQTPPQALTAFLLVAFGFGLAAIFTPCVFPMIPITMSYFLNRPSGSRAESVGQAALFCGGIVVLFTGMGLVATAVLGPFGIVQIGSNPWVNGFIALVFFAFGLSLLGAFEITIPSRLLTRLDSVSQRRGGIAGTLLMGLTFSLTSFACVGPFVGTLLAASVQSGGSRPLFGMMAFACGLALPFFLLAVFPSYLKRMPKSGGWLARVKVVMGFVILAAMFKYLSSVDQVLQWNFLTRERFLAAWVVLFALAGLYLLGFLRLEGIKPEDRMGTGRLLAGAAFLIFAISLVPGMFGQRLGELDAYVPLAAAPDGAEGGGLAWIKNDLDAALANARGEDKLVFVSFTGYACTNCHWMKANMFTRPEVVAAFGKFVLVELYTDGTDAASEANQRLQESKFATIAIPYYAILRPDGTVAASFPGLTRDPGQFLAFLDVKAERSPAGLTSSIETGFDPAQLRGNVGVVNFWATWCVPCIQEIPSFNRIHEELGPKGVRVIGVSMDEEGAPVVQRFLKDHPMKYTVALGQTSLNESYRLDQLPVTVVYDRAGTQRHRFEGYTRHEILEAAIKPLL